MSRIGIKPIKIEDGVAVNITGKDVSVKGPLGELKISLPHVIDAAVNNNEIVVTRANDEKLTKSLHGTYRMIISNAVKGVKTMFSRKLEIVGVGYRTRLDDGKISLSLGYNHPVLVEIPADIKVDIPDEVTIIISGIDKQHVGEYAGKIRALRKPEPYKGKGIMYEGEYVRRKSRKAATV